MSGAYDHSREARPKRLAVVLDDVFARGVSTTASTTAASALNAPGMELPLGALHDHSTDGSCDVAPIAVKPHSPLRSRGGTRACDLSEPKV